MCCCAFGSGDVFTPVLVAVGNEHALEVGLIEVEAEKIGELGGVFGGHLIPG